MTTILRKKVHLNMVLQRSIVFNESPCLNDRQQTLVYNMVHVRSDKSSKKIHCFSHRLIQT